MNPLRSFSAALLALLKVHWIAVCVAAGLLLLYTLAGFFLVPHIARTQIERYVSDTLHRKVTIGEIRFNPFVFDTSVSDFSLTEADDTPLIAFRHLYVNAQLASLWRRAVVLHEVQLSAPDVHLVVDSDGSVNLARLAPPSTQPPEENKEPMRVRIGTLDVREGRVGLEDHTHPRVFTAAVAPIRFTLTDFRTDANFENAFAFAGVTSSGERLRWAGKFTVQPLGSFGTFGVDALKAATLDSYLADSLPFRLASGTATLSGNYRFGLNPTLTLDVALPSLELADVSLAERTPGATAPIVIPHAQLGNVTFSYEKRDLGIALAQISKGRLKLALEPDGSIDLMRLFRSKTSTSTDAPAATVVESGTDTSTTQGDDWFAHIDTIRVADAAVEFEDRSVQPAVRLALSPLQLTVGDWNTRDDARLQLDADVTINDKGRLRSQGEIGLTPLTAQLTLELKGLELAAAQPYLERSTALTLHSGQLAAKGEISYSGTPAAAPPIRFKGDVQVTGLRTTDQFLDQDFVKWNSLAVSGIDFSLHPDHLVIDKVVARQPYGRVIIAEDTSLNVSKVLRADSKQQDARTASMPAGKAHAPAPAGAAFPVRIKAIDVIDGSANFADYSIDPSFAAGILELNGRVTGLSSDPDSRATVKLDGKVDKYAPVDINGTVNLLSASKFTDLAMNFRNMELTTFNPYSGKFAGYNISKGKLSTELHYKVQDRKLDAAHHIVLDNLEFGAKTDSKDAAPIPLKLAVALLKDRNGVIDLNLPVSGTLDDPKFRLGPIIWKAFIGLLTKIVTAPFAALGALFGGGEDLAYVDFPAGSAVLAPDQAQKLSTLAKALIERPQLRLNVPMTVVMTQDGDALAQAALSDKLPPEATAEATDERARRKRTAALEKAYSSITGHAPEYPPDLQARDADPDAQQQFLHKALLEQMKPDDAALTALARDRARAVQDALLANTGLDPERVFITTERNEGKRQGEQVRMEMKLE